MTNRFPTESNFQVDLLLKVFPLITLFQLSMHLRTLHQINERNTHVPENLYFIMESTGHRVITGENYIDAGTIVEA